jgi:flagellar M-ring protein FliF
VNTLRQIEWINDARVKLAFPKSTYFVDKQTSVTASVFLKVGGSGTLSAQTVQGIASLVSHSVPELSPENVSILDHEGQEITQRVREHDAEFELEAKREQRLQEKLQEALRHQFGARVHSVVNLSLDFSQEERRRYTPGEVSDHGSVEDSVQRMEETLEGGGEAGDKNYSEKKEAVNYKYSENYFATLRKRPTVERITASVMVDGASDSEVADIKGIVRGAIGIDESRNDEIFVSTAPWNRDMLEVWEQPTPAGSESSNYQNPAQSAALVALGVGLALAGLGLGALLLKRVKPIMPMGLGESGVSPVQDIVSHRKDKSGNTTLSDATAVQGSGRVQALEEMVLSEPSKVLTHLKSTWLND